MRKILGTFLLFLCLTMVLPSQKVFSEDPTPYILKGLASYDIIKKRFRFFSKKIEKSTGLSKENLIHIGGTLSQIANQKLSTKLLNISTEFNSISISPAFEYSFKTDETLAKVGINYSF